MKAHLPKKELYTSFISGFFFPLHERIKGHVSVAVRDEMEVSQWWDRRALEELQLLRLRKLLVEAEAHVPYYRKLFSTIGCRPDEVQSLADLSRLPLLDKSIIRSHTALLKSATARDLKRFNTGGSSGEPLIFYIDKERVAHDVAAKWRATRWWDVDIGDREIVVWGSPIELGAQDGFRAFRDRLLRTTLLPAFEMSEGRLDSFLAKIRSVRPKMLFGYPSALSHIARHAGARGTRMDDLGIRVAFVTSERLYDEQREQIRKTFGCAVANGYGGRDAGFIAHECPEGGMHLTAEDIIVEIIDSAGLPLPHGESGEIVITHLATRHFPFIRYRTGDIGVLDNRACRCGRGLPLLREIQGRSTDFVIARDGTVMHGLALIYILRGFSQITNFKIMQESLDLTRVLITAEPELRPEAIDQIQRDFKARLGREVDIIIENMAEIPAERSGKFRYVVSKVTSR